MTRTSLAILLVAFSEIANAAVSPRVSLDPRVGSVSLSEEDVAEIDVVVDQALEIKFPPDLKLTSVAFGRATGWSIEGIMGGHTLTLRAGPEASSSNGIVSLDRASYLFEFNLVHPTRAAKRVAGWMSVRVDRLPNTSAIPERPAIVTPQRSLGAADYEFGSETTHSAYSGTRIWDDGTFTYFAFPLGEPLPAIFVVDSLGSISLTNMHFRDGIAVVHQVSKAWELRYGSTRLTIHRQLLPGNAPTH